MQIFVWLNEKINQCKNNRYLLLYKVTTSRVQSEKVSDQILPSAGQNGLHVALDVKSHYEIIYDQWIDIDSI